MGVMNGICNYILICMQDVGLFYDEVFVEVDVFGYLEVDLNLDVGGIDVGYKLVLLVFIVFGMQVSFDKMEFEGIQWIFIEDIKFVVDMGFKIKFLGVV